MKILIVEDEALAARRLKNMLKELRPADEVAGVTGSIAATISWLKDNKAPDIIFMDIELLDGQSFEIFENIRVPSPVIFTTAYDEFALKAFKVNSLDYLLKPIEEEELLKALDKLEDMRNMLAGPAEQQINISAMINELKKLSPEKNYKDRFLVKLGQRFITIDASDISFFYANEKLVYLHCNDDKEYLISYSLDELEQMLHPKNFFRANRQYILNISSIGNMHTGFNGKLNVVLKNEKKKEVIISREKAAAFKEWLGE